MPFRNPIQPVNPYTCGAGTPQHLQPQHQESARHPTFERKSHTPEEESYSRQKPGGVHIGFKGHIPGGRHHVGSSVAGGLHAASLQHPCAPLPEQPLSHRDEEQVRRGAFQQARFIAQGDASVRQFHGNTGVNRFAPFGVDPEHAPINAATVVAPAARRGSEGYLATPEEAQLLWHHAQAHGSWGGYANMSEKVDSHAREGQAIRTLDPRERLEERQQLMRRAGWDATEHRALREAEEARPSGGGSSRSLASSTVASRPWPPATGELDGILNASRARPPLRWAEAGTPPSTPPASRRDHSGARSRRDYSRLQRQQLEQQRATRDLYQQQQQQQQLLPTQGDLLMAAKVRRQQGSPQRQQQPQLQQQQQLKWSPTVSYQEQQQRLEPAVRVRDGHRHHERFWRLDDGRRQMGYTRHPSQRDGFNVPPARRSRLDEPFVALGELGGGGGGKAKSSTAIVPAAAYSA